MGAVLNPGGARPRPPNCLGVYELCHIPSGRRLIGVTTDLNHNKLQHLGKLARGVHENRELQRAYNKEPELDYVYYPCPSRAEAERIYQELIEENELSGRLFEAAEEFTQPVQHIPKHYQA